MMAIDLLWVIQLCAAKRPKVPPLEGAEHDIIYFSLTSESVAEDSSEGAELVEHGCHFDEDADCWAAFV